MNDFEKMVDNIGNRFDFILIASERVREINRERKLQQAHLNLVPGPDTDAYFKQQRKIPISTTQAFNEIESGSVGLEYIDKIRRRGRKT